MNVDLFIAISEAVGIVILIISIFYLASQVKQGTRFARLNAEQSVIEMYNGLTTPLMQDKEYCEQIMKALEQKEFKTKGEALNAHSWFFMSLRAVEAAHYQYENGVLDQDIWDSWKNYWVQWLHYPGLKSYWEARSNAFRPSFQLAIKEMLENIDSAKNDIAQISVKNGDTKGNSN